MMQCTYTLEFYEWAQKAIASGHGLPSRVKIHVFDALLDELLPRYSWRLRGSPVTHPAQVWLGAGLCILGGAMAYVFLAFLGGAVAVVGVILGGAVAVVGVMLICGHRTTPVWPHCYLREVKSKREIIATGSTRFVLVDVAGQFLFIGHGLYQRITPGDYVATTTRWAWRDSWGDYSCLLALA